MRCSLKNYVLRNTAVIIVYGEPMELPRCGAEKICVPAARLARIVVRRARSEEKVEIKTAATVSSRCFITPVIGNQAHCTAATWD